MQRRYYFKMFDHDSDCNWGYGRVWGVGIVPSPPLNTPTLVNPPPDPDRSKPAIYLMRPVS